MKHKHDCDKCEYLGTMFCLDFYLHEYDTHYSMIARYGNNENYFSVISRESELNDIMNEIGGLVVKEAKKILAIRKLGTLIALNYIKDENENN